MNCETLDLSAPVQSLGRDFLKTSALGRKQTGTFEPHHGSHCELPFEGTSGGSRATPEGLHRRGTPVRAAETDLLKVQ